MSAAHLITNANTAGWMDSVVFHCGSKFGTDPAFKDGLAEICTRLPDIGVNNVFFGGGKAGLMGVSALEANRAGVKVHGITLPFFSAAQGDEDPLVTSVQRFS